MDYATARMKWNPETFSNLLAKAKMTWKKEDMLKAFEYRKLVLGKEIPEEYREDVAALEQEEEHTEESLKELLKENNVQFSHLAKFNGLKNKALEHNLI